MFYLTELFFRFKYSFLSLFLSIFIAYFYKNILFILLTFPLLDYFYNLNNFIYTHPTELLTIHFLLILLISLIFQIPYILWHFLDFIKTSLLKNEYFKMLKVLIICTFFLIIFNFLFFFFNFSKILAIFL